MAKRPPQPGHSEDQMTFSWMEPDPSALLTAAKNFLDDVRSDKEQHTHFLVSCGKRKQSTEAKAAELYTSPRFRLSVSLPQRLHLPYSVLSAKHGLLEPDATVQPYDASLASLAREARRSWAERVIGQLLAAHYDVRRFVLLTENEYRNDLVPLLVETKHSILEPLLGYDRSWRMSFLKHCHRLLDRQSAIESLYECFGRLGNESGLLALREALTGNLPNQGVYFFFDPCEPTRFSSRVPRLVRIGTHGVSSGSKATLRDRLRTHFGTMDGYGNHRASVFRQHIGEALIRRDNLREQFPNWGRGQNVERSISDAEKELERKVSEYISRLQICCIEVSDKPTKHSARSKIERLSIALFTEGLVPVESPTKEWLGLHSAHDAIARTGLWNVRDAGSKADFEIVNMISKRIAMVSSSAGKNVAMEI
jgi:hypothetical protein